MKKEDIFINSRGGWQPNERLEFEPIFVWPPQPKKFLKWILEYIWPWNIFYFLTALLTYLFFQPSIVDMNTFSLDWISIIFFRNLFLVVFFASLWHLRLYTFEKQKDKYKFNLRPLSKGRGWLLGTQTRENIFWCVFSAVPIMTAYEVLLMWAYSNDLLLFSIGKWYDSPFYFCLMFLIIPLWHYFHFFMIHRISHLKVCYKMFHYLHHKNVNTGPWCGLSMHPIEHILYFSSLLIHFIIPTHMMHFIFQSQRTALMALYGHSGFAELVINEKTNFTIPHATYFHYLHHKYFECNYGDLTIPFDKWFGSFHDGSKELHEKLFIKNRKIN